MKKVLGVIAVFSFALVLSGCSIGPDENKVTKDLSNKVAKELKTDPGKSDKEICMATCVNMWSANPENAGKPEDAMRKNCDSLCEAGLGIQAQDLSICDKSEGVYKDTCYSDIAKNTRDPKLCEKVKDDIMINACYVGIVEVTKDGAYCDKITDRAIRDTCFEQFK